MRCSRFYVLSSILLIYAMVHGQASAGLPPHPTKSNDVMFVDDANEGKLYPGQQIGNSNRFLVYQNDGNLVFYDKDIQGVTSAKWATGTNTNCPGYAEVSAIYGIAVYNCNGTRQYNLYNTPQEHTNFHLALEFSSLRLYNMETSKMVWRVNADSGCGSCTGFVDFNMLPSQVQNAHAAQGWSHTYAASQEYDHEQFQRVYNDSSHSKIHRFFHGMKQHLDKAEVKVGHFLDKTEQVLGIYDLECAEGKVQYCKNGISLEEDVEIMYDEAKVAVEYLESLGSLNEAIESGELDPVDIFNSVMPTISPDGGTDLKIYEAVAAFFSTLNGDDSASPATRSLAVNGGDAETWWRGNVANGLGRQAGRTRFDLIPFETLISFGDVAQIVNSATLSAPTTALFNSIQVRAYFTFPSYDPVRNESKFQFRVKVADLAGAKLAGPDSGVLSRYKLDFDAGITAGHEWVWTYVHRLDNLSTTLEKVQYVSSLGVLAEGTFSFGALLRSIGKSAGQSLGTLASQTDAQTQTPSDISHTDVVQAADQNAQNYQFELAQSDLGEMLDSYESLSTDGQGLVDSLMVNDSATVTGVNDALGDVQPVSIRINEVLDPDPFDPYTDGFIYTSTDGQDVRVIDNLTTAEVDALLNSINEDASAHEAVSDLLQTGVSNPPQGTGQFEVIGDPDNFNVTESSTTRLLGALKSLGMILAGQVETGLSCSVSTVYEFSEFSKRDKWSLYGSELAATTMFGATASVIAAYLAPEADVSIGNASAELGGYAVGDSIAKAAISNDKHRTGWDCGVWGAYRPEKLALVSDWQPLGLPSDGINLGLGQRMRLQIVHTLAGSMAATNAESTTRAFHRTVADVTHSWKAYELPYGITELARLDFMQTYNGADTANIRSRKTGVRKYEVFIEEEKSQEDEINHAAETIGVMAMGIGDIVDVSGEVVGEAGRITFNANSANDYRTLTFSNNYSNPVVVMAVNTYNGGDPVHVRLANLSATSVEYKQEEWDYRDGAHTNETISYVVLESGAHLISDGKMIVAGSQTVNTSGFTTVNIASHAGQNLFEIGETPVVFAQPHEGQTDGVSIVARLQNVDSDSFDLKLEREEALVASNPATEEAGFIILGSYDFGSGDLADEVLLNFNDYTLSSYAGGQDQVATGSVSIGGNGTSLSIDGNRWQSLNFNYTVTPDTVMEFTFESTAEGEIHGIGFDDDNSLSSNRMFEVYGVQNWGFRDYTYTGSGPQKFVIPVGTYFTGAFDRLVFSNDGDSTSQRGNSTFSDIFFYEAN